jgi:hypothetical protein
MPVAMQALMLASGSERLNAGFAGIPADVVFWVLLVVALIPNVLALAAPSRSSLSVGAGVIGAVLAFAATALVARYVLVVPGVVVAVLVARELRALWAWLTVPIAVLLAILTVWELPLDWIWMALVGVAYALVVVLRWRRRGIDRSGRGSDAGDAGDEPRTTGH